MVRVRLMIRVSIRARDPLYTQRNRPIAPKTLTDCKLRYIINSVYEDNQLDT